MIGGGVFQHKVHLGPRSSPPMKHKLWAWNRKMEGAVEEKEQHCFWMLLAPPSSCPRVSKAFLIALVRPLPVCRVANMVILPGFKSTWLREALPKWCPRCVMLKWKGPSKATPMCDGLTKLIRTSHRSTVFCHFCHGALRKRSSGLFMA